MAGQYREFASVLAGVGCTHRRFKSLAWRKQRGN
jgi:hypothetical protein